MRQFMKLGEMFLSVEILVPGSLPPGNGCNMIKLNIIKYINIDKRNQILHDRWKQHCPTLLSGPKNSFVVEKYTLELAPDG